MNIPSLNTVADHPATGIAIVTLVVAEAIWAAATKRRIHNYKESAVNIAMIVLRFFSAGALGGYVAFALRAAYGHRLLTMPGYAWPVAFLLVDFLYYAEHYAMHKFRSLWFFHRIHHSSPMMNLTTSFRLHFLAPLLTPVFFAPAAFLGAPPALVVGLLAVNKLYQFWLHTEAVGKIPFLEGILNTPSAHRVHHAQNDRYVDRNFGGVLMVWDRLCGTYTAESEAPVYGVVTTFPVAARA